MKETRMSSTLMAYNYGRIFYSFMCQDVGCSCSSESSEAIEGAVAAERSEDMEEEKRNNERPDEHREPLVGQRKGGRHGSGRGRMSRRGQGRFSAQQGANQSYTS